MSATLLTTLSRTTEPQTTLRRFLAIDAVVTGGNGLVYVAASGPVGTFLGVGSTLLFWLGVVLVLFGGYVGHLGSRPAPPAFAVRTVVEVNAAWVVASLASLVLWFSATAVGTAWILAQAAIVAGFAAIQYLALRARG